MNTKLEAKIEQIKNMTIEELCEKFDCAPEQICMGDYIAKQTNDKVCPYKVILGFANFERSDVVDLGDLEVVYGKKLPSQYVGLKTSQRENIYMGISLKYSKIVNTGKLRKIYGSITLNPNITSLGNIEFLGSNFYISNLNLSDLGALKKVDGILYLNDDSIKCKIKSLKNLNKAKILNINTSSLRDLGNAEEFRGIIFGKHCSDKVIELFENSFEFNGSRYVRKDLTVTEQK